MCKNIFSKYILTFMIIVVISFLVLSLIVSSLIGNYTAEAKKTVMNNTAQGIFSSLNGIMSMSKMPLEATIMIDNGYILDFINKNATSSDSIIFITDHNGKVILLSDNGKGIVPERIDASLVEAYLEEDYLYSDLEGVFDTRYINVIRPVNLFPAGKMDYDAEANSGAIFICSENTNFIFEKLGSTMIMTLIWIFAFSLIAVYFISERISRPLKEMSYAAKSFAQGKFNVRVPVRGNDEVAELATAFNNMAGSLEKLEENRSTFLSNVSHDLRTPMTTIAGFVDGIISGAIPRDKADHYLRIVSDETKRLARLVNSLLDITRIQSGERKFTMTSFDICELARQVLISCESRIDAKKLDVSFECDDDNINVIADKDAIHQVMYNLIDNAVKFANEQGNLSVRLVNNDKKVVISVKNTGNGISAEDLPRVFDRFYKSDRSRGLDKSGLGLGLYISKTIIDQHSEEMWVKSEENAWCEFTFTLTKAKKSKVKEPNSDN